MSYVFIGLGNPKKEHEGSRHNTGRALLMYFAKRHGFPEWEEEKKAHSLVSRGTLGKQKVALVLPETFMNHSGKAAVKYVKSKKAAERLVVLYDDIDVPLGAMKISFGRGSGGHRGLESVIKALHSKNFIRIRIGIAPSTPSGKVKKPKGEEKVLDFLLGKFRKPEVEKLKKVFKRVEEALETILLEGLPHAMNRFN